MARGYPGEHRARQRPFPAHPLARGDHRERPRGRDAQAVHGLADDILAQHRAYRGLAVGAPGERGTPGPLDVQIAAAPPGIHHLAEQQRAAVPEARRVAAELVAGVGLGDRRNPLRHLPNQQRDARRLPQLRGIGAQLDRELLVEHQQSGGGRRGRGPRYGKAGHLAGVGILEPEQGRRDGHTFEITGKPPPAGPALSAQPLAAGTRSRPATRGSRDIRRTSLASRTVPGRRVTSFNGWDSIRAARHAARGTDLRPAGNDEGGQPERDRRPGPDRGSRLTTLQLGPPAHRSGLIELRICAQRTAGRPHGGAVTVLRRTS
jgi:hypothetical protein